MININHEIGKSKLRLLFAALALALAVTGSSFVFAYTTDTGTINAISGTADFAEISANVTVTDYRIFGNYRGRIQPGNLFDVTPTTNYPGDVEINVYLANIDELSYNYGLWCLRVHFVDGGSPVDVEGLVKTLTLENGVVSFVADNLTAGTTYHIKTTGGIYRAFPWAYLTNAPGIYSPTLTAEVIQAGL